MSTLSQYMDRVIPSMFNQPTFGYAVCLGELFDWCTNQFLGVQLYNEESMKKKGHTFYFNTAHLSLLASRSIYNKCSILDLNTSDTLDMLAGLVKVKGFSSYFQGSKTNNKAYSWALILKMETEEDLLSFPDDPFAHKIPDSVKDTHLANGLATHFVSSILYGGNVIISMAEKDDPTRTQCFQLNNLMGHIFLTGNRDTEGKSEGKFDHLNNKFDLVVRIPILVNAVGKHRLQMYGDIELERDLVNIKDVIDIIPHAANLICGYGAKKDGPRGVLISVTLHPIPIQHDIFTVFSKLEDIHNHFTALVNKVVLYREFSPKLAQHVLASSNTFGGHHTHLMRMLGQLIMDI
ncbi:hypothetical protein J3A83DRAFT_4371145 [Scleroderma citrinum]